MLPDEITRVGDMYGKNFSDGNYTYSELSIPYKQNDEAFSIFKINKSSYTLKIDAIADGNLDELNKILQSEGFAELKQPAFDDIKAAYLKNQMTFKKEKKILCDTKYGICGEIAEWWSPDGKVKWFDGGKPQFVMPLSGRYLKLLGIIN